MKNTLALIFVFLSFSLVKAQCVVSFEELNNSTRFNLTQFETFALQNGYSYNSEKNTFMCDEEYSANAHSQLLYSKTPSGYNLVQYIFFEKSNYLAFKKYLESRGELIDFITEDNAMKSNYIYDGYLINLISKTFKGQTVYFANISNEKFR